MNINSKSMVFNMGGQSQTFNIVSSGNIGIGANTSHKLSVFSPSYENPKKEFFELCILISRKTDATGEHLRLIHQCMTNIFTTLSHDFMIEILVEVEEIVRDIKCTREVEMCIINFFILLISERIKSIRVLDYIKIFESIKKNL